MTCKLPARKSLQHETYTDGDIQQHEQTDNTHGVVVYSKVNNSHYYLFAKTDVGLRRTTCGKLEFKFATSCAPD